MIVCLNAKLFFVIGSIEIEEANIFDESAASTPQFSVL